MPTAMKIEEVIPRHYLNYQFDVFIVNFKNVSNYNTSCSIE